MGLGAGQDPSILEVANLAAEKAFRMVVDSLEVDTATGVVRVQGTGPGGAPIQATHLDMAFPFGHYSLPPADVEGVAVPGAVKAVVVATRDPALPADLKPGGSQAMTIGESVNYSRGGIFSKEGASKGTLGKSGSVKPAEAIGRVGDPVWSTGTISNFNKWAIEVEIALAAGTPINPAFTWALIGPELGKIQFGSANWDCD